jgi:hypothetical protein
VGGVVGGVVGDAAGSIATARAQSAGLPVPFSGKIGFKVLRNGTSVGEHHLTFTQAGDQLLVDIEAALVVRVAGIPVFRYSVSAQEHWAGSAFCGVNSKVNHDGTKLEVHASPIAGGFAIQSTKAGNYSYTGQPAMLPLTYWNKAMLDAMILNIETGRHYPAIVNSPGWNYLPTAEGGKLLAQRFDVTGKLHLSVWYDQYAQWAGLEFNVAGDISFQKFVS